MDEQASESPWALIRSNSAFTRIWIASLVSFAGDWIASVALLSVLLQLTGHGIMVSLLILSTTLSQFVLTPLAGVIADRWDRQKIMVWADSIRAVLVLGYLLVHTASQVWIVYAITVVASLLGGCFAPAASAALPNLVTRRQLVAANALSSAAWGTMLAVGAGLGGLISWYFGRPAAYVADSLSFVISAVMIASVRQPFAGVHEAVEAASVSGDGVPDHAPPAGPWRRTVHDFVEALHYAVRHRTVLALLLLKTVWGMGGGVIALLSVYPVQVLHRGDLGVGTLYATRGLGALIGPLLAHLACRDRTAAMPRAAAIGLLLSGTFYALFSLSPTLWLAAIMIFMAHLGAGIMWVLSTTLLQRMSADSVLGRISSLDMGGITLTMSVSTLLCGWGLETIGPRAVGVAAGLTLVCCALVWVAVYLWWRPLQLDNREG